MRSADLKSYPMLERLIAFDTTSRLSNLALIDWVREYLDALGVPYRLTFDDDRRKANLFATLGPGDRPGIVLSGHTDVVPVDGQPWDSDPFAVIERDGLLYGRGTCDMKGFLAVVLTMVPRFLERGLTTPIHLALSYDEEVGCLGVRRMLRDLEDLPVRPSACIVGEPTGMKVMVGHKGKLSVRCRVRGLECHSSLAPRGVNAVEYAAETIAHMKALVRKRMTDGPFDRRFDPPFTTIHTGVIQGGTALNIVPLDCCFDFELRHLPGDDPEAILAEVRDWAEATLVPEMQAIDPATGIRFEHIGRFPGLDTPDEAEVTVLAKAVSGSNDTGRVPYGTEAGLFQQSGIPTIICGPGDIEQAHKPNEFVSIEQMALCEGFMQRLMDRVCA